MGYDREEIAQRIADEGWCPDDSSFYDEDGYQIVKTMFVSDTAIDAYIAEQEKLK